MKYDFAIQAGIGGNSFVITLSSFLTMYDF